MNPSEFVFVARESSPALPDESVLNLVKEDVSFRNSVCEELNKSVSAVDRQLARYILQLYTADHKNDWGMSDDLRLSAFLLHKIGNVEDSLLIWEAKEANFDTFSGLDIQLVVGAGVDETLTYLRGVEDKSASEAASYIEECRETGDFNRLDSYVDDWEPYFRT